MQEKGGSLIGCMKGKRKQLSNDLSVRKSDSDHWKASPVLIRGRAGVRSGDGGGRQRGRDGWWIGFTTRRKVCRVRGGAAVMQPSSPHPFFAADCRLPATQVSACVCADRSCWRPPASKMLKSSFFPLTASCSPIRRLPSSRLGELVTRFCL